MHSIGRAAVGEVLLCAMRVGEEIFGIETMKVREVLGRTDRGARRLSAETGTIQHDLRRVPLAPGYVAGLMPYRGEVLTTLSLRALLGVDGERAGGSVVVIDDGENGEQLGLMVDGVSGVVTVLAAAREPNPCTLDARRLALFEGVYRMQTGLIGRLDPMRLSQKRLAAAGVFGGGSACGR